MEIKLRETIKKPQLPRPTIVGNPALIVVDIFESDFESREFSDGIPSMEGAKERMEKAAELVKYARNQGMPIIVIHEIHRGDGVDAGRDLDGSEDVHCIQDFNNPNGQLPFKGIEMSPNDCVVFKRRYSAFYHTDLEIMLKGLNIDTLILVGGMTDICVHYTFVDGHQGNYYCRVISDGVSGTCEEAHQASLNAMEYLQKGAVITADEMKKAIDEHYGK